MMATASATQYTCNEVANEYTTNCGTCGDTTTNTESGLEKPPATLTEVQKMLKFMQWLCDDKNKILLGSQWHDVMEKCGTINLYNSFGYMIGRSAQHFDNNLAPPYAGYTPLDL